MTRDEALALVREYVKSESLVRHMLSVEAAMCLDRKSTRLNSSHLKLSRMPSSA